MHWSAGFSVKLSQTYLLFIFETSHVESLTDIFVISKEFHRSEYSASRI